LTVREILFRVHIPDEGDQRSGVMSITIPG
jgi:hypothetical protein